MTIVSASCGLFHLNRSEFESQIRKDQSMMPIQKSNFNTITTLKEGKNPKSSEGIPSSFLLIAASTSFQPNFETETPRIVAKD